MTLIEISVRFVIAVAVSFGDTVLACCIVGLMSLGGHRVEFRCHDAARQSMLGAGYKVCTVGAAFLLAGQVLAPAEATSVAADLWAMMQAGPWVVLTLCVTASVFASPVLASGLVQKLDESRLARQTKCEAPIACKENQMREQGMRYLSGRSANLDEGKLVARLMGLLALSWTAGIVALSLGVYEVWSP